MQKQFFIAVIEMRYEQVLVPVCRRIMEQEIEINNSSKAKKEGVGNVFG